MGLGGGRRWVTHLGRLASPGGGGVAMEVGAEGLRIVINENKNLLKTGEKVEEMGL